MNCKSLSLLPVLVVFCSVVNASPILSEVFYDAVGNDAGETFIELYGDPGESLDGLILEAVNGFNGSVYLGITLSGVFPNDGIYVIGDQVSGVSNVHGVDKITNVNLQNGPDSLVLRNDTEILDALAYGDFAGGLFAAGEGNPADDVSAGFSLERSSLWLDTDNNAVDFVSAIPTPGSRSNLATPLPASIYLLASSLLAFAGVSRRRTG